MTTFILTTFTSIFFIVNPLGNTPVFLALTEQMNEGERRVIIKRASVTVTLVLILFAVLGHFILGLFHLTLPAIRIAGGIILFLIASNMIQAERVKMRSRPEEEHEARERNDISIVPLAIPMLAGPGSITTILVLTSQAKGFFEESMIVLSIMATGAITFLVMSRAVILHKLLGKTGINIFTRLMGLLLAALAVQFVLNGITEALPMMLPKRS